MSEPVNYLGLGRLVVARFADGTFSGVGRCIAYCDAPTVAILTAEGKTIHWRADMCEIIGPEDVALSLVPYDASEIPE